jgi:hypothetical protein
MNEDKILSLIDGNKLDHYFVVYRRSEKNSDKQIFNDLIQLRDNENNVLYVQAVDSIADKFIMRLGKYCKPTEDDYTISEGIMPIRKSFYRNRLSGLLEPAYIILSGLSRNRKWKLGKHYTLNHMIHRSSYYNESTSVYRKKVKRGSSGGCMVLPRSKKDILTYADQLNVNYLVITEEFE